MTKEVRSITDILKDADRTQKLDDLVPFINELNRNKDIYPSHEYLFANEHLGKIFYKFHEKFTHNIRFRSH